MIIEKARMLGRRYAIYLASRRPAPPRISLSYPKAAKNDFFTVQLTGDDGQIVFYMQDRHRDYLSGLYFNPGAQGGFECSIPERFLPNYKLQITHYLKGYEARYTSALDFIAEYYLHVTRGEIFFDRLKQLLFNRVRLVRRDRMRVLRMIFERSLKDHRYEVSSISLASDLYSMRFFRHPHNAEISAYYSRLLESLQASEDLKKQGHSYVLGPKALQTLDAYEDTQEKHQDNVTIQNRIGALTLILALIAMMQVGVTIWEELHPDPVAAPKWDFSYPAPLPVFD